MRVLFITSSYPASEQDPRGTFIHVLARSLVEQGVEVTVLAPGARGASTQEQRDGVRVHRATYWIPRWQGLASGQAGMAESLRRRPWLAIQLPSLIGALWWKAGRLAIDADLVHAHWAYPAGLVGAFAARRARKPLVVTSHGSDLNLARAYRPLRALVGWVARRAAVCTGVSETMVSRFRDCGAASTSLRMLPLGIAATQPDPREALRRVPEARAFAEFDGLRVVCVGRLIPSKSVETLLAAQQMLERDGQPCACLIVGDGPLWDSLRATARAHGTSITVFIGSQPPSLVPSFLAMANAFAMPSLSEGRGLVVVEAMSQGLPVVASDIDALRELVSNMDTGLTFPAGNAAALADCLMRLQNQPALATRLGQNGQRFMREQGLTSRTSAIRHAALYTELLASAGSQATPTLRTAHG